MEGILAQRLFESNLDKSQVNRLVKLILTFMTSSSMIKPVVVYNFDYDGCMGGVTDWSRRITDLQAKYGSSEFPKRQKEFEQDFWGYMDKLDNKHSSAEKLVLCGSARQDYDMDLRNRTTHEKPYTHPHFRHVINNHADDEGLVTRELERLIDTPRAKQHNWKLYPLLWTDGDGETGKGWKCKLRRISSHGPSGMLWNDNKVPLLKYQINRLCSDFGTELPIHMYFFDDRKDILDAIRRDVITQGLPDNVKLTLISLDWNRKVIDNGETYNVHTQ